MITGSFEYHRPATVDEVISLLAEHGDEGRVIAGGQSLIPMMKLRMAAPSHIIDLQDIDGLRGITVGGDSITIGAMTSQAEVIASNELAAACPILRDAALVIADPQVRNKGTIGGNAANGDPGNDTPAIMMALDATYHITGPGGARTVAARNFYEAAYFTKLEEGELLTAIEIATPPAGHGAAYEKLKRKTGDYATAAAAVVLTMNGGTCASAAIALTNVGDAALYAQAASEGLVGTTVDDAAISTAVDAAKAIADPISDMRGSAEYRTAMTGVMTARAIRRALVNAGG
jgi:carbon-monoxide dehydrogenase medium subunit